MRFAIIIGNSGETFHCNDDMHVLEAMEKAMCLGIPVGCRNGGCGACKVRITSGEYVTQKMNRAVVNATEELQGYALACKAYPRSDLKVTAVADLAGKAAAHPHASFTFAIPATAQVSQPEKEK